MSVKPCELLELKVQGGNVASTTGQLLLKGIGNSAFLDTVHSKPDAVAFGFKTETKSSVADFFVGTVSATAAAEC